MSNPQQSTQTKDPIEDDEPDDWDKRIFSTGCAEENTKMNDCYFEKKDWRACKREVNPHVPSDPRKLLRNIPDSPY
ncbi:MAG: hypothetical protein M4579_002766 [Chaenotheca gracillima]|nr:MAG: hypothetical protein M4579_002766 [Chaenotheca gracillima]